METDWELAGLTVDGGGLTRPMTTAGWRVPAVVELEGTQLLWRYHDGDHLGPTIRPRPKLLETFVALADADPEAIRDYARKWGILMICEHGIPAGHSAPRLPMSDVLNGPTEVRGVRGCLPQGWPDACWEPVGAWYVLARQARAMLNVAAALHRGVPARRGDWHTIVYRTWYGDDQGDPWLDSLNQPTHATHAQAFLEDSINRWLAWGAVQPILSWSARKYPTIVFDGYGLFGALAVQLLAVVCTTGWAICSACGGIYDPGPRRPNPNRRNYCPDCRASGTPQRDAMRDLRKRRQGIRTKRRTKARSQTSSQNRKRGS
jgi:hypothetical protein